MSNESMINGLLGKERGLFLLDHDDNKPIGKIRLHFQIADKKVEAQKHIANLNFLANSFIFRGFAPFCHDENFSSLILEDFRSPVFRANLINRLPCCFHKILRVTDPSISNIEIYETLSLSSDIKKQAIFISNHAPFANTHDWFTHFEQLIEETCQRDFMVILLAAIMRQHCMDKNNDANEISVFQMGICNGYIHMLMAEKNDCHPIRSFATSLCYFTSLFYIFKSLSEHDKLPNKENLLQEINQLAPKIAYWIAKDWGFPDEVLVTLKERFQFPEELSLMAELMQKSEHANLAIALHQQGLLSRKQTQKFIDLMGLECLISIDQINTITH